ncbi:hypothetical protein WKI71_09375 [Streptomyces sp. MS1.AVA.1]|uniref:Uncharacterized protein n=1 Tax=Streptomyces machairae TaxID=3134109 RepID=A0ABU8UIA3_9ACTN
MRLPLQRVDDVDEAVRDARGQSLRLDLLDDLLHRRQRDLLQLLLHLLLGLLCLLILLLAQLLAAELLLAQLLLGLLLPELLAELLEQLLVGLLLAELLELLQRTAHAHAGRLLLAVALLLSVRLLLVRLLLVRLLLVRRRARELLALLLSHVTHLRGGAHTGVTFP